MIAETDKRIPEKEILDAVRELRFGMVEIVVHENRVTEIRQIRRKRFPFGDAGGSVTDFSSSGGKKR